MPSGETPAAQQALHELRRIVVSEVLPQIDRLESQIPGVTPPVEFALDLFQWAAANLSGNEWRLVEAVCLRGGRCSFVDLAVICRWHELYDSRFSELKGRVHRKIKQTAIRWRLRQRKRHAELFSP
jgi:hypothetical protein